MDIVFVPPVRPDHPEDETLNLITASIIKAGFMAMDRLGTGFLEIVYRNACAFYLEKMGFAVEKQAKIDVFLEEGVCVGTYFADLLVNNRVIVELKVAQAIDRAHVAQVLNYLRATKHSHGLILNFGTPRLGIKRVVNGFDWNNAGGRKE